MFTGFSREEDFKSFYRDHKAKIRRIKWAHLGAGSYPNNLRWIGPDKDDVELIDPAEPILNNRMGALYVEFDPEALNNSTPKERIKKKDAKEIIHIVEVALYQIMLVTEYCGHQIGTKGFMK